MVYEEENRAITWDVSLNFDEPDGAYDYCVFGEAPDANDGPPADAYDTVKPPAPMPSYIRSWFNDYIPYPYNTLWKDYRHYPALTKTWNLTVQWVPEDAESPTTITISWGSSEINTSEYVSMLLCTNGGTPLKDMLSYNSYSFSCPAFLLQRFKIICTANQAPYAPGDPFPSNNTVGIPVNSDLGWTCNDPNGDPLRYDVYFGTTTTPPRVANNITETTYDPGTMVPGTIYYWRIIARDIYNAQTPGDLWHFQANDLPSQPTNPNPTNNSIGLPLNPILSWTCSDPNGDSLTYDVRFGTGTSPPIVSHNQSTTSYNPGTLNYGTRYYWKITAWDSNSGPRNGLLWNFKTNSLPNLPSNPNPSNGSTGVLITTNVTWNGTDPDGDTVTYDVYFGLISNPTIVAHNLTTAFYNPPVNLQYTMTYYWLIKSWDIHNANRSGPLWHFTTGGPVNDPPYMPSGPSPEDDATNVPLDADLSWVGGDPNPGDTVTYWVYFGTTNPPPLVSINQTETSFDPGNLTSFTTYYWRIKAWDDQGLSTLGPLWNFKTLYYNEPPYVPYNPIPSDNAIQVPINTDLCWQGGDPDSGDMVTYDVYFGTSFPLMKIKSNISGTSCFISNLNYSQEYYWQVVAWDNHGHRTPGPLWSFTTILDITPPSVGIVQPKKGWLYISFFGGTIHKKWFIFFTTFVIGHITVIASASDSQSGVDRVEFYVDDDLKHTDYTGDGGQYTWDWFEYVPLFPYELKVIAYDKCSNHSQWSLRVWKIL